MEAFLENRLSFKNKFPLLNMLVKRMLEIDPSKRYSFEDVKNNI